MHSISISINLPYSGSGYDYQAAISAAIGQAQARGDNAGAMALAGLLNCIYAPPINTYSPLGKDAG